MIFLITWDKTWAPITTTPEATNLSAIHIALSLGYKDCVDVGVSAQQVNEVMPEAVVEVLTWIFPSHKAPKIAATL